jgi:putative multiple sugar transport system permease protein
LVLLLAVGFDIFNKNRTGTGGGSAIGKRFKWRTPPAATDKSPAAATERVEVSTK